MTNVEQNKHKPKTRKISEMTDVLYVTHFNTAQGVLTISCDPSAFDIDQAITNKQFELRGFQSHLEELKAEWSSQDIGECCLRAKKYHAQRIANFVVNGWNKDPITLNVNGEIIDGLHRWKAARHMKINEVEIKIEGETVETS